MCLCSGAGLKWHQHNLTTLSARGWQGALPGYMEVSISLDGDRKCNPGGGGDLKV